MVQWPKNWQHGTVFLLDRLDHLVVDPVGILTCIRYERTRTHGSRESERGERERYRPSGLVDELEESMASVSVAV